MNRPRTRESKRNLKDKELLDEIVRRIVRVANPIRIILFGSRATGKAHRASDFDLLVVVRNLRSRWALMRRIRKALRLPAGVDIITATPKILALYGDNPWMVYQWALKEGIVIYGNGKG